jgi:uncharacterized protein YkvS
MAKIQEQILIIKLSKLVKDDSNSGNVVADTDGLIGTLEQVAQELVDKDIIVEVETVEQQ